MSTHISRRDVLKNLAMGMTAGPALSTISAQAAEHVHHLVEQERADAAGGGYTPKFFSAHQYQLLSTLCGMIIPADDQTGGAVEAGAPAFIDLLTSENSEYQMALGGGLAWLESSCIRRYGKPFLDCSASQQKEILDLIAYRDSAVKNPELRPGVAFFSLLRDLTSDGFFTSKIGIKYLEYIGNTYLAEFPGCPPLPES
jgi:gluconate 2-dehydrogenase gamma chain